MYSTVKLHGVKMEQSSDTIIELSKAKLILIILGSAAFFLLGIWMLSHDAQEIESSQKYNSTLFVYGIAWIAIAFSALCGFIGIKKIFDNKPGLIISAIGIEDNSSGFSVGLIPWEDITGISQYEVQSQSFVSILVADPDKYAVRGNLIKRMANRTNIKMCGTPLNIASNSLKISHDELLTVLTDYYQEFGKGSEEKS